MDASRVAIYGGRYFASSEGHIYSQQKTTHHKLQSKLVSERQRLESYSDE